MHGYSKIHKKISFKSFRLHLHSNILYLFSGQIPDAVPIGSGIGGATGALTLTKCMSYS